jgi:hypothetical protein
MTGLNKLAAMTLAVSAICCNALAQTPAIPQPLPVKVADENGVDVVSGYVNFRVADVGIGPLQNEILSILNSNSSMFTIYNAVNNGGFTAGWSNTNFRGGGIYYTVPYSSTADSRHRMVVSVADINETFFINSDWTFESYTGGTLVDNNCDGGGQRIYTSNDGVQVILSCGPSNGFLGGLATKITYPNGRVVDINYYTQAYGQYTRSRIQSVTSSDGAMLRYNYAGGQSVQDATFHHLTSVQGINLAYDYCAPLADVCNLTYSWPQSQYLWSADGNKYTIVSQTGSSTRFTMDVHRRVIAVKPSSSAVDKIFYQYCARIEPYNCSSSVAVGGGSTPPTIHTITIKDRVKTVVVDGQTWEYIFPTSTYGYYYMQYRSNGPENRESFALTTILGAGALLTYGRRGGVNDVTANFENSARNRLLNAAMYGQRPETYTYDARGNVLSNGFATAGYDAVCANQFTCNQPNWARDPAGNQTDFTYSPVHGGVLTVTGPAVNGIRPQTRYEYAQRYAWLKNAAGAHVQSASPIWVLSATSLCRTSSATGVPASPCALAGDEVRTTYEYGPNSGPNNLLQRGVVVTADGQSTRTCLGYDHRFQKISETQPAGAPATCP